MNYRTYLCTSLEDQKDILALLEKETSIRWASSAKPTECVYYDETPDDPRWNMLIIDMAERGLMFNPRPGFLAKKARLTKKGFVAYAKKHYPKN